MWTGEAEWLVREVRGVTSSQLCRPETLGFPLRTVGSRRWPWAERPRVHPFRGPRGRCVCAACSHDPPAPRAGPGMCPPTGVGPEWCWLAPGWFLSAIPCLPTSPAPGEARGGKGAEGAAPEPCGCSPEGSAGLHPRWAVPQDHVGWDLGWAGIHGRHQTELCPHLTQLPWPGALCPPKPCIASARCKGPEEGPVPCPCQRPGEALSCWAKGSGPSTELQGLEAFWCPLTGGPKANLVGTGLPSQSSGCVCPRKLNPVKSPARGSGVSGS